MRVIISNRFSVAVLAVAALWAASPAVIGMATVIFKQQLPLKWSPEVAALPGLFILERLFGFPVPTHETDWTTIQITARAAIFIVVNMSIWMCLAKVIQISISRSSRKTRVAGKALQKQ